MLKLAPIVRTAVLVLLIVLMLRALPFMDLWGASPVVNKDSIRDVATVGWLAIAWVAAEAGASWIQVWLAARKAAKAAAPAVPPAP
jgi:hypothetical protein